MPLPLPLLGVCLSGLAFGFSFGLGSLALFSLGSLVFLACIRVGYHPYVLAEGAVEVHLLERVYSLGNHVAVRDVLIGPWIDDERHATLGDLTNGPFTVDGGHIALFVHLVHGAFCERTINRVRL